MGQLLSDEESDTECASVGKESALETRRPDLDVCLATYLENLHAFHSLMTEVNSYYFEILRYQRKQDAAEIEAEAVRGSECWREQLDAKRIEALECLTQRAEYYNLGERSCTSGRWIRTAGADSDRLLRSYKALLCEEYDAAAQEVTEVLKMLEAGPGTVGALLEEVQRRANFWQREIEETFEIWHAASVRFDAASVSRDESWAVLQRSIDVPSLRQAALLRSACAHLLVADLHQYAHGLKCAQRRSLIADLFCSARERGVLHVVGRDLLLDTDCHALASLSVGCSEFCALDVKSDVCNPWGSELQSIFGELLISASRRGHGSLVVAAERLLLGFGELAASASTYARPRTLHTPLHGAVLDGNVGFALRLLELRADPLACDLRGNSPFLLSRGQTNCLGPALVAMKVTGTNAEEETSDSDSKSLYSDSSSLCEFSVDAGVVFIA